MLRGTHLVDHPGTEPPLQRHLVDNHGVLHVVARVGDDGHNGVGAHRVVVQPDEVVVGGTEERRGRSLEPVQFRLWKNVKMKEQNQDPGHFSTDPDQGSGWPCTWVTGLVWGGLAQAL
jgi:hypothetical protein